MSAILNSSSGGYWQGGFGGYYYTSNLEAYINGCIYNEIHNSWGHTEQTNWYTATTLGLLGRDAIRASMTASLEDGSTGQVGNRVSIDFQGDSKLTIGVQAGGNVGGFGGQFGISGNLVSVTLIGNEGKKIIYPTSQQDGYTQINQGLSGGLIIGAGVSHTFDGSFVGYGYANDSYSYSYSGWLSNKKGIFGFTYLHSAEVNTINIGFNLQMALILGFEGMYNLRIKW